MRFFARTPETEGRPFWHQPLGPLGIAFAFVVVLGQVWLIAYLTLGPTPNIDWLVLGVPLALLGVGLIVWALIGERRAAKDAQEVMVRVQ